MAPKQPPVRYLVKLRYPDPAFIGFGSLCDYVHGRLTEVKICPNARCSGDSDGFLHILYDHSCKFPRGHPIGFQICGDIQKNLVYGVDVDVLRSRIFQIYLIDSCAVFHIVSHARLGNDVVQRQRRIGFELGLAAGGTFKPVIRSIPLPFSIHLLYPLYHLKQSRPAGNAAGLQGGGDCEADGLFCSALIRNHKVCGQRVKIPLPALYGSVKGF